MSSSNVFRQFCRPDKEACLAIFDANCPSFFAPNERVDYERFLETSPKGYEVCEMAGRVVAAFGLLGDGRHEVRLNWIMLHPRSKGLGLGSTIMERVIAQGRASQSPLIGIAASQKSAPFFARFGAVETLRIEDGWGPGMDRVDMEIVL